MKGDSNTIVIHARVPVGLVEEVKQLIEAGYYSNLSDAVREGLRRLISESKKPIASPPMLNFHELPPKKKHRKDKKC